MTTHKELEMHNKVILLVEDNPDDVKLTMRALKKSNVLNEVVVAQTEQRPSTSFCTEIFRP
jgi:hypothetical protein